jgi:dCTP deaminase
MILSNVEIRQLIETQELVTCYGDLESQLQPASFDFRLMDELYIAKKSYSGIIVVDPMDQETIKSAYAPLPSSMDQHGHYWLIEPDAFLIGSTIEYLNIPNDMVCEADGRSSIGRLGLTIHQTAGFVDPGFKGRVTLEIKNESPHYLKLRPGMRIGQFVFMRMSQAANPPYMGRYQNQDRPEISRYAH